MSGLLSRFLSRNVQIFLRYKNKLSNGMSEEEQTMESTSEDVVDSGETEESGDVAEQEPSQQNDNGEEANNVRTIDTNRIRVDNLPKYCGHKQFRKILEKNLPDIKIKKIRQIDVESCAYVLFESEEDTQKAIKILDGLPVKKSTLAVKLAEAEERKVRPHSELMERAAKQDEVPKTARESVTPLADVPYSEQLVIKNKASFKLVERLLTQLRMADRDGYRRVKTNDLLKEIKPAPKTTEYRNKCEMTVGLTLAGEVCVGFVGGRYSKNQHYVIPIDDVNNVSQHTKAIITNFTTFVKDSALPPFDEFARVGVWRMLTIREFGGDVMVIVTVHPMESAEKEAELKKEFVEKFLNTSTFSEKGFRITSVYWQRLIHASDEVVYEHIGGTPYIYETVLDCRFRVSPSAFFQTNSQGASVLYTTIGEQCGLVQTQNSSMSVPAKMSQDSIKEEENTDGVQAKKPKLEEITEEGATPAADEPEQDQATESATKMESEDQPKEVEKTDDPGTILLDICCGTGTIGMCILKEFKKKNKVCCVGIEMVASAVEDAKQNAKDNGMGENICRYIAGKAEDVFRSMRYHLPPGFDLLTSKVVGVLDPPRSGMHEKVIVGCRLMNTMRRLVFVSCDPSAAMKNLVDLCRPSSKKFPGQAFTITQIQPVDMFPQTNHFEWVVTLDR